jgi:hypothetical protein
MGEILVSDWTLEAFKRREDQRRRNKDQQTILLELTHLVDTNQEHNAAQRLAFIETNPASSHSGPDTPLTNEREPLNAEAISFVFKSGDDDEIPLIVPKLTERPASKINRDLGSFYEDRRSLRLSSFLAVIAIFGLGVLLTGHIFQDAAFNRNEVGKTEARLIEFHDNVSLKAQDKASVQALEPGQQQNTMAPSSEIPKVWTVTITPNGAVVGKGEMLPDLSATVPHPTEAVTKSSSGTPGQADATPNSDMPNGARDARPLEQTPGKSKSKASAVAVKAASSRNNRATAISASNAVQMDNGPIALVRQAADSVTNAIRQLGGGAFGARP